MRGKDAGSVRTGKVRARVRTRPRTAKRGRGSALIPGRAPQNEFVGGGSREEAKRDERRPQPRGEVQRSSRPLVQPLDVRPSDVGQAQLPAGIRQADLAGVEMAGEDEVEETRLQPVDHLWEVTEEDPQLGIRVGEPLRPSKTDAVGTWIDADDMHLPATQLDRLGGVDQQARGRQIDEVDALGKRILRYRVVMISQDGIRVREAGKQLAKKRLTAS